MAAYIQLIRHNPDFARLWLAQVISLLGDWFATIVLSALVVQYSDGNEGSAVSLLLLARLFPPLLVSPLAGVLIDRFDRKRLLIISDLLRALVVFLLVFFTRPETLWMVYVLTIIQFAISAIFEPGHSAIMPSLLSQEYLVTANTLSSVTWSVMLAMGAVIGGVVAAVFGVTTALLIDAITFLVSAVLILQIRSRPVQTAPTESLANSTASRSFADGLRYFFNHPASAAAILIKTGLSIGSVDSILIIYGSKLFVLGESGTLSMAILWSAFGVGAILGPIFLNRFSDGSVQSLRRLVIIGFIWVTIGWLLWSRALSLEFAVLAVIVRAMGGSVNWTYSSVIIQKSVPDAYLGRMFSLDMAGFQLMQGLSTLAIGQLIDSIGTQNAAQVVVVTGIASTIPLLLWIMAVRRLEAAPLPVHSG